MNNLKTFLADLYYAIKGGCWLNHAWPEHPIISADGKTIEHVCQKCGKRAIRHF